MEYNIYFCLLYSMLLNFYVESRNRCILLTDSFSRPSAYSHCEGGTLVLRKCLLVCTVIRCNGFQITNTQAVEGIQGML